MNVSLDIYEVILYLSYYTTCYNKWYCAGINVFMSWGRCQTLKLFGSMEAQFKHFKWFGSHLHLVRFVDPNYFCFGVS